MSTPTPTLTEQEAFALLVIHAYVEEHGYQPTVRELATAMGLRSPSSGHRYVVALEAKGYLRRVGGRPRAVELR